MAQASLYSRGNSLDHTAASDLTCGDVVVIGSMIGIANSDAATGEKTSLEIEGIFAITKQATVTFTVGATAYWDDTNKYCNATSSGNTAAGKVVIAAAGGDAVAYVKLNR